MNSYWFEPCGGGDRIGINTDVPVYLGGVYDIIFSGGDIIKCYIVVEEVLVPDESFVDGKIIAKYDDCSLCVGDGATIVITEDDNNIIATKTMTIDEPLLAISLDVIITDGSVEYNLWGYSIPLIQNYVGGYLDVNQEGTMDWMPNFPELAVNNKYKVETTGSNIEVLLPILFNWRYYQSLPTLAAIFGQNATKNWRWYQENGWQIKAKISTLTDVGSYIDEVDFEVRDYDDNSEVNWTWEMFRESTLDPITSPISGEKAIIKVTADMPSNTTETIDYATVTVEGFEQPTRWLISSVYEHLNQSNSPLQPIQFQDRLKLTNVTGANNSVELEFIFDASKISSNNVKFTGRIYQQGGGDYTERNVQTFEIPFLPPEQKEPEYEAGECCDCPSELKLASLTSDELRENDIAGVVHKNQTSSDICTFEIYKNGELLPNNGVDYPNGFPHDDKVSAFVYNWKYYLANHGVGCYEIKKKFTIAGINFEQTVGNYELKEYTPQNAKGTARVLYQNNFESLFDDQTINFADSGFEDSYRFEGFFGKWQPNVISESDFSVRNENRVSSIKSKDNYRLIISGASECEIKRIHKIVMSAAVWRMSDHNPSNALQEPIIYECVLDKENSEEITYHDGSKISDVEIILSKRQQNSVSLFNGSLQLVQGATWLLPTVAGGGGGDCPDATVNITNSDNDLLGSVVVPSGGVSSFEVPNENITVNGNLLINKPSVKDYDVEVVDGDDNPIGVISGGKVVVSGGVKAGIAYREPNISSITNTSYADYDAGWRSQNNAYVNVQPDNPLYYQDLDYNSADPYNTLLHPNIFGNKFRFTDTLGVNSAPSEVADKFYDHLTGRLYLRHFAAAHFFESVIGFRVHLGFYTPSMDEYWSLKNTKTTAIIINGQDLEISRIGRPDWTCNTDESDISQAITVDQSTIYPTRKDAKTSARWGNLYVSLMHPISNP